MNAVAYYYNNLALLGENNDRASHVWKVRVSMLRDRFREEKNRVIRGLLQTHSRWCVHLLSLSLARDFTRLGANLENAPARRPLTFDSLGMWVGTKCRSHCQRLQSGSSASDGYETHACTGASDTKVGEYPKARVLYGKDLYDLYDALGILILNWRMIEMEKKTKKVRMK